MYSFCEDGRIPLAPAPDDDPAGSAGHAFVYCLFEHQSTVDPLLPLRLLEYMIAIWHRWLAGRPDGEAGLPLPVVLPLVLYHGEGAWRAAPRFASLFAPGTPELWAPFLPDFTYSRTDLGALPDDAVPGSLVGRAVLRLWRAVPTGDADLILRRLSEVVAAVPRGDDPLLVALVIYLIKLQAPLTLPAMVQAVTRTAPAAAPLFASIEERLLREGEARGEARGKAIGETAGKAAGEARGRLIASIQLAEEVAGEPVSSIDDLRGLPTEELERRAAAARARMRDRLHR